MKNHEVKSWPDFFDPVLSGVKNFELRHNDRDYHEGDTLTLREWDDRKGAYTGRKIVKRITYVLTTTGSGAIPPYHGLIRGYAILSLAEV